MEILMAASLVIIVCHHGLSLVISDVPSDKQISIITTALRPHLILLPELLDLSVQCRVQGVLYLTVSSFGIQVHRPGEVHERQVDVSQLVVSLQRTISLISPDDWGGGPTFPIKKYTVDSLGTISLSSISSSRAS